MIKDIRVGHVIPSVDLSSGGPSHVVRNMIKYLNKIDVQTELFTTDKQYMAYDKNYYEMLIKEQFIKKENLHVSHAYFTNKICYCPEMKVHLEKKITGLDLLHIHSTWLYPTYIAAEVATKANVPYIIRPAGNLDVGYSMNRKKLIKGIYYKLREKRVLSNAANLHFTTEEEMQAADWTGFSSKGFVIPNGVDIENLCSFNTSQNKNSETKLQVLYMSRLHPKKGLDILIESIQYAPNTVLTIAGPDVNRYEEKMKALVNRLNLQDRIQFVGMLQGERKLEALHNCDVCALTSHQENFGVIVAEAMAVGKPVIISKYVNLASFVEKYQTGKVVELLPQQIGKTFEQLFSDSEELKCLGSNAKKYAKIHFDWNNVAIKIKNEYSRIISSRAK